MPVGMSFRLRQAYVAAKLWHFEHLTARARQSEATAARSSEIGFVTDFRAKPADEQELIPTEAS
jgi:hypothetical protein